MTDEATRLLTNLVEAIDSPFDGFGERVLAARNAARAYLSRPTAQAIVPPREPTQAMVEHPIFDGWKEPIGYDWRRRIWKAMYDAAIAEGKPR